MSADVVPIHGGAVPDEPVTDIVERLECLLDEARSGQLRGLAYAVVRKEDGQGTGWAGGPGTRHTLGTAVMMLNHRYVEGLREAEQ